MGHEPGIEKAVATERGYNYANMTAREKDEVVGEAQSRYLAVGFVLGADRSRYGRLIENLENDYLQGQNNYPTTHHGHSGIPSPHQLEAGPTQPHAHYWPCQ